MYICYHGKIVTSLQKSVQIQFPEEFPAGMFKIIEVNRIVDVIIGIKFVASGSKGYG
jgi:hypothetical protein